MQPLICIILSHHHMIKPVEIWNNACSEFSKYREENALTLYATKNSFMQFQSLLTVNNKPVEIFVK